MKYSLSTYLRDVNEYKLYLYKNSNEAIIIKNLENYEPFFFYRIWGKKYKYISLDLCDKKRTF